MAEESDNGGGTATENLVVCVSDAGGDSAGVVASAVGTGSVRGWAYWNVVVSRIEGCGPGGFPAFVGVSYWHVAYRLYARFRPAGSAAIEGLYFVRSDCDSPPMTLAGNVMTDFNLHTARVRVSEREGTHYLRIDSDEAPARAAWRGTAPAGLQAGSPFGSLDEAAAALKYKPSGLSVGRMTGSMWCGLRATRRRGRRGW